MRNSQAHAPKRRRHCLTAPAAVRSRTSTGFTLTELLFVMLVMAVLVATTMSALANATQEARIQRCRAQIAKIDQLLMEKWETYRTRQLPMRVNPGTDPRTAAQLRLRAIRHWTRLELPDRFTDISINGNPIPSTPFINNEPVSGLTGSPTLARTYQAKLLAAPNRSFPNQAAECLYLILSQMRDGESSVLDFFLESEIGDVDGDGLNEILDPWGQPIFFLRWAPGYSEQPGSDNAWGEQSVDDDGDGVTDNFSEAGWPGSDDFLPPPTRQTRNAKKSPDPFDPLRIGNTIAGTAANDNVLCLPYAMFPLVVSGGPDRAIDLNEGDLNFNPVNPIDALHISQTDPYWNSRNFGNPANSPRGTPVDTNANGTAEWADNITNHELEGQ